MQTTDRMNIDSGTLEALKWVAVVLMTIDHINTFVLGSRFGLMFDVGRVAFPLFGFVFAYNMGRPGFFDSFLKRLGKLVAVGLVAQVFMVVMGVPTIHLNIMFTLALAALAVYLSTGMPRVVGLGVAVCALSLPGLIVDYGPLGVLYILTAYNLTRRPTIESWMLFAIGLALLYGLNQNLYAMAALPIVWGARRVRISCPRAKQVFYAYYPLHLAVLAGVSRTALFPF